MTVVDDMLAYLGIATGLDKVSLGDLERAFYAAGGPPGGTGAGVTSVQGRTGIVTLDDIFASAAAVANKADVGHSHAESGVTNLVADLAGKAAATHSHVETDVTNLSTDLTSKADASHTHAESAVTNLVSDLAGKSATGHSHAESAVTNLVSDLAGKSATGHGHAEADVTSLVTDLAGKSNTGHSHAESDVTSLSSDLAGKAPNDHRVSHLPGGTNAMSGYGTAAAKPSAASVPDGYVYSETNTNGGTLWQNQANTWVQIAVGVTAANGYEIPGTYAENVSGTPQTIAAGGNADVTNLAISVPATARPVWIEIYARCTIGTVVGTPSTNGQSAGLALYETTSGSTLVEVWPEPISNAGISAITLRGKVRIASSTSSTRTFKANIIAAGTATNGIGITVTNTATVRSWMAAFAA